MKTIQKMLPLLLAAVLASCGGRPAESSLLPSQDPSPSATSEPAQPTSVPTPETSEPLPETSEPAPEPETSEPAPATSEPTIETSEPTPETSEPAPETSEPAASSSEEAGDVYRLVAPTVPEVPAYKGKGSTGTYYEIFVYSFADSNGDGIGDLNGIRDKLDYLEALGVEGIWLTPIHPSSSYHKYNVDDYYAIDSSFGTMRDFEELVDAAKQKGIRVMMDMVFNHSSLRCPWFNQSVDDFINDRTGEDDMGSLYSLGWNASDFTGVTTRPYNYAGRTVYYECNFDGDMPEFNLDSPVARRMHKEIMEFWVEKGVEGFRFDGVAYYYKGVNQKCFDYCEYLAGAARDIKEDVDLVAEFMNGSQALIDNLTKSKMTCFNFATAFNTTTSPIVAQNGGSGIRFTKTAAVASRDILINSEGECLPAFFSTNHDLDRWAQKTKGDMDRTKGAAAMYLLTPGTPFMYYGEEIELRGIRQNAQTDANRRLPMQWRNNGTADPDRCTPCSENDYKGDQTSLGGLDAIADPTSLASYYGKVNAFRKAHPDIQKGLFLNASSSDHPFAAFEIHYGDKVSYLIHNVDEFECSIRLDDTLEADFTLDHGGSTFENGLLKLAPYSTIYLS